MRAFQIFLTVIGVIAGIGVLVALILAAAFLIANRTNGHIISSGERRSYLLYVPDSYDGSSPTPLVIVIHGFAQWPANQERVSQWNTLADEEGFIVVYPSGTKFPKRWRATGTSIDDKDALIDVRFISDLIDKLESQYNIDPARIFANGLSNGGGMSYLLGCTLSDRIAAIGGVAGAYQYPMDKCTTTHAIPMMVIHGDTDPVVPYYGGPSDSFEIPFPLIPEWVKGYAALNKCKPSPEPIVNLPQGISGLRYSGCAQNAEVVFYTIAGGGHSWPGGSPLPKWIVGETSQSIDASRLMWEFFKQHPMP